jgi:NAD+ kinase
MDGQVGNEFQVGDWIELHRSETLLKVFRNPKRTYYQTLRDKLRWGKR